MQGMRFGRAVHDTAEKGIRKAKKTRFLILHAEHDRAVRLNGASVYARRAELESEGSRVKFEIVKGRHHLNAWFSPAACEGDEAFEERYQKMVGRFGFQLTKAQEAQFYSDIGREERIALSEPDQAFFRRIDTFFREGI